jgi:hypothetical protein
MEDHDYAADVVPAFDSYGIVVAMRAIAEADRTEDNYDAGTLARNERHLGLKMAAPAFVDALTAEQKGQIEALNITL